MAVPKSIHDAKGLWRGKSQLNLPFLPPDKQVSESDSSLHIDLDGLDTYATVTYNWHQDGKRQEGTMILCMSSKTKAVQIGWVDSWHQNTSVLYLKGEETDAGVVKTKGSYRAGKETWGWTISFQLEGENLRLEMENLMPHGQSVWAVRATYKRD